MKMDMFIAPEEVKAEEDKQCPITNPYLNETNPYKTPKQDKTENNTKIFLYAICLIYHNVKKCKKNKKTMSYAWYLPHNDKCPSCMMYGFLLTEAQFRFNLTREQAREKYGLFTNNQWIKLLNVKQNKL